MKAEKLKVVIVTGLSGAGKTCAADWFEDHGYYVVDNMPPALIPDFLAFFGQGEGDIGKIAMVADIRGEEFFSGLEGRLHALRKNPRIDLSILFIEASNAAILRRFSANRREHPLAKGSRTSAKVIEQEREMLAEIRGLADYTVDTTKLKVADLYAELTEMFTGNVNKQKEFKINVLSFGYKYGTPQSIDIMFDMRFLPNPFYVSSLRNLTGNNKKVQHYVLKQSEAEEFLDRLDDLLEFMIPHYMEQGKYYLNLGFGCTGGQHRSVVMANTVSERLRQKGYSVTLEHRELEKR